MVELPPWGLPGRTRIRLPHASPIGTGSPSPPSTPPRPLRQQHAPRDRPQGIRQAQKACWRRDGVCVQERACAHVREKEAGL